MDRQRSESRTRRNAACRAASSAPAPHARYRESNASRLRQEIKGMTITGTVRKPRSRSNSASASPPPPESRKSPARAASRQPSNERPKPKTDQQQPPPTPKEQEKEKPIDMESTPRSMSNTSDFSRDTATSAKISVNSSGYTVDSARSKDTSHPPTAEEVMDIMSNASSKRSSGPPSRTGPIESHEVIRRCGYGKPLVTPVNKKLTIRRDLPWPPVTNPSRDKVTNNIGRTKSPTRAWKAENRESPPPTTPQRPECLRSKILKLQKVDVVTSILGHLIFWRVARITSCLYPHWGGGGVLIVTVIVFAVLFWTATKATVSGNKLRASNTSPNVFPDTKIPIMRSNIGARSLRTSVSSLHRSNSRSPTRPPKSAGKNPQDVSSSPTIKMKPAHTVLNGLHDHREVKNHSPDCQKTPPRSPNRGRSPIQAKRTLPELKKPGSPKKALPSQGVRERQKSSVNSDGAAPEMHHSHPVRPNPTGHSNRSFKPQLEDIKSSYLLLNKKPQDLTIKACANSAKKKPHVPRLNPVTEEVRKQQLTEVKQKFQSKHFWIESKYDKIEGLNWISWK